MSYVQAVDCPDSLLARYRALVLETCDPLPELSPVPVGPVTCSAGLFGNDGIALYLLFRDASRAGGRILGYVAEASAGNISPAWCAFCAADAVCPHLRAYLDDLRVRIDLDDGTGQVSASPLRTMLACLNPESSAARSGSARLGLLLSDCDDKFPRVRRLCVRPFTYRPDPYYGSYGFVCDCGGGFDELSESERDDLMLLCGIEPYSPRPVMTAEHEAAFLRIARGGILLRDASRFVDEFVAYPGHAVTLCDEIEPIFFWDLGDRQEFWVDLQIDAAKYEPLLCGARAWCVPAGSNKYIPIAGDARRMLAAWSHPKLTYDEAEALTADDTAPLVAVGLPAPWKPSAATPLDSVLTRRERFIISRNNAGRAEEDDDTQSLMGRVSVSYGDKINFPQPAGRIVGNRGLIVVGKKLYSLPAADVRGETPAWLLGSDTRPEIFKRRAKGLVPVRSRGQSARAAWLNAIAHLQRHGVEVVFDGDAAIAPATDVDAQPGALTATEVGDRNVYEIAAPIVVAGKAVDIAQALGPVVNDPLFEALVSGEVPAGARWAVDLPDGTVLSVPVSELKRLSAPVAEWLRDGAVRRPRLSSLQVVALGEAVQTDRCEKLAALRRGITRLVAEPDPSAIEPATFGGTLREYQRQGFDWLSRLHVAGFGGVLADDMGLGKTVQTLAHVLDLHSPKDDEAPTLVVCPTSVAEQWERAAALFTPGLRTLRIHGDAAARVASMVRIAEHDLVITTYAQALRDQADMRQHVYGLMVLDEAQQVKNGRSQTSKALRALSVERTLVVTGTPVENNLGDLWAMLDFAMPGALGDETMFRRHFRTPIEKRGDAGVRERLTRMVAPFILRRLKGEVAKELPAKTEEILKIEIDGPQRKLYEELRSDYYASVMSTIREQGLEHSSIVILTALLKLRQACDDPRLIEQGPGRVVRASAKLDALMETLHEAIANGRHVLVYSCFTKMLDLISDSLAAAGIDHLMFTGASRNRQSLVDRFQSGRIPVFLVSLKAGGTGLNLTAADTVIHYDPWWNPAVEDQATDRAHRIGQDKPVLVYKFVCTGTLEEHILAMQARKAALAKAILDNDGTASVRFDMEDVEALLGVSAGTGHPLAPRQQGARPPQKTEAPPLLPEVDLPCASLSPNPGRSVLSKHDAPRGFWKRLGAHLAEHHPNVPALLSDQGTTVRMAAVIQRIGVELRWQSRPATMGIYVCFRHTKAFPVWQALSDDAAAFNAVAGHTWTFGRAPTDRVRWIALQRAMSGNDAARERRTMEWLGKELDCVYRLVLPYVTASGVALAK